MNKSNNNLLWIILMITGMLCLSISSMLECPSRVDCPRRFSWRKRNRCTSCIATRSGRKVLSLLRSSTARTGSARGARSSRYQRSTPTRDLRSVRKKEKLELSGITSVPPAAPTCIKKFADRP